MSDDVIETADAWVFDPTFNYVLLVRHRRHGWVPGHYVRRGGYNAIYARKHFRHHRVWIQNDWR